MVSSDVWIYVLTSVVVGLPDVRGRIEILKHHMADVRVDSAIDASVIARGCPGMSGADLQNLVNQVSLPLITQD
jgi:ATP-dependent metalloprotease